VAFRVKAFAARLKSRVKFSLRGSSFGAAPFLVEVSTFFVIPPALKSLFFYCNSGSEFLRPAHPGKKCLCGAATEIAQKKVRHMPDLFL
jgi:hypothetical protein